MSRSVAKNASKVGSRASAGIASRTSTPTTVPMTSSTRRTIRFAPGTRSDAGLVERRLERLGIGAARVGRAGDDVDLRALGGQGLAGEDRCDEARDRAGAAADGQLEGGHRYDPA